MISKVFNCQDQAFMFMELVPHWNNSTNSFRFWIYFPGFARILEAQRFLQFIHFPFLLVHTLEAFLPQLVSICFEGGALVFPFFYFLGVAVFRKSLA